MLPTPSQFTINDQQHDVLLALYNFEEKKVVISQHIIWIGIGIITAGLSFLGSLAFKLAIGLAFISILALTLLILYVNYRQKQLTFFFQKETLPSCIPVLLPNFGSKKGNSFDLRKIRSMKTWQHYQNVELIDLRFYIHGRIRKFYVSLIYQLTVEVSYRDKGELKKQKRTEDPIFILVSGLPTSLRLSTLRAAPNFIKAQKEIVDYWGYPLHMETLASDTILFAILTDKKVLQPVLWEHTVSYTSNFLASYYEQLYYCLHFIEVLDKIVSKP